ncbi:MAG: hypothetical protein AYK19_10710 [Theionarchaea archaeon DG-70-1]|nr:MAG: hypothetical protein AYK19_10710 [Theionarchaea archaeon DG-70-1]
MCLLYPTETGIGGERRLVGENMNKEEESEKKKTLIKVAVALALWLPFNLYFILTGLFSTCSRTFYYAVCHIPLVVYVILFGERRKGNIYYLYIALILLALLLIKLVYDKCIQFGGWPPFHCSLMSLIWYSF